MRIFNTDGSEAEACGNGLRCIVHYIKAKGLSRAKNLTIETAGGVRKAEILGDTRAAPIRIGMGAPVFEPQRVPVDTELGKGSLVCGMTVNYPLQIDAATFKLGFVSMGNPHAVYFTDKPVAGFPLVDIGPNIETAAKLRASLIVVP